MTVETRCFLFGRYVRRREDDACTPDNVTSLPQRNSMSLITKVQEPEGKTGTGRMRGPYYVGGLLRFTGGLSPGGDSAHINNLQLVPRS